MDQDIPESIIYGMRHAPRMINKSLAWCSCWIEMMEACNTEMKWAIKHFDTYGSETKIYSVIAFI